LTRHIDEQVRGLVVALFMPVFFLSVVNADLAIIKEPSVFDLTICLILIASIGKFTGAFVGGAQANRVKNSCGNETCKEIVVPSSYFALERQAMFAWSFSDQVVGHVL
jgi:Kef-type K+ transport system membrane component KefB